MTRFASPASLQAMVAAQKRGVAKGIYSVCSANQFVIEAVMQQALHEGSDLLIESTCNQVNQFGGYTGMTPADFAATIAHIAGEMAFPPDRLILGGDHLGPYPWRSEPSAQALDRARGTVHDYVQAGYVKIHLDASMHCANDDADRPLDPPLCAKRAADLCVAAEQAASRTGSLPVYVIGTEVPSPGGGLGNSNSLQVTSAAEADQTVNLFHHTFRRQNLESAWDRVIGLVVQPGVEFSNDSIHEYDRAQAKSLSHMIKKIPGIVFEAHSTDYQRKEHLRQMVEDHFAILKIGPALTFALREALFALAHAEHEWLRTKSEVTPSNLIEVTDKAMLEDPGHWANYYTGSEADQAFARKYSLSDRIRYYWPKPVVRQAVRTLIANLVRYPLPLPLVKQFLPAQFERIRKRMIPNHPQHMVWDHIREVTEDYADACSEHDAGIRAHRTD